MQHAEKTLKPTADASGRRAAVAQDGAHESPRMVAQRQQLHRLFGEGVQSQAGAEAVQRSSAASPTTAQLETAPNRTGMPDGLKAGIESLSGVSLDQVKVHYNSSQPAQLGAHAYAQGSDIHVAPGQEQHLPHEAWHVVQQAQGRVQPTMRMNDGVPVNDDATLENEADVMGSKAMAASPQDPLQRQAIQHAARASSEATWPALVLQSPRMVAQGHLIDSLMRPSQARPATMSSGRAVAQREPSVEAWAEYLLLQHDLQDNPHAQTLLAMRQVLIEHGQEKILAALKSVEIGPTAAAIVRDGDDGDGEAEAPDHEPAFGVIDGLTDALEALNDAVYEQEDVDFISDSISALGLPVTRIIVQAVKDYNYRSTWIDFNPENFHCWMRLATGNGSMRDAQYLIHEAIEIGVLLQAEPDFDPFMTNEQFESHDDGDALGERFSAEGGLYTQAHLVALEYEYRFVAMQVNRLAGLALDYRAIAAADEDRTEPARLLPSGDGMSVADSDRYAGQGDLAVDVRREVRELVGLGEGALRLKDLVKAVKATPIALVAQLKRDTSSTSALASVAQRAILTIDGEEYDTRQHTVAEIAALANRLAATDPPMNRALYEAIKVGEFKEDEQQGEDEDDYGWGAENGEAEGDLMAELQVSLHVPNAPVHATLLSRGEICNFNHDIADKGAEGFLYDSLDQDLGNAQGQPDIKRQIASLVWSIVHGHVFLDGNKRTGQAMLVSMAGKNGLSVGGGAQALLLLAANNSPEMTREKFITDLAADVLT